MLVLAAGGPERALFEPVHYEDYHAAIVLRIIYRASKRSPRRPPDHAKGFVVTSNAEHFPGNASSNRVRRSRPADNQLAILW